MKGQKVGVPNSIVGPYQLARIACAGVAAPVKAASASPNASYRGDRAIATRPYVNWACRFSAGIQSSRASPLRIAVARASQPAISLAGTPSSRPMSASTRYAP